VYTNNNSIIENSLFSEKNSSHKKWKTPKKWRKEKTKIAKQ
jgi:hypothetical protein